MKTGTRVAQVQNNSTEPTKMPVPDRPHTLTLHPSPGHKTKIQINICHTNRSNDSSMIESDKSPPIRSPLNQRTSPHKSPSAKLAASGPQRRQTPIDRAERTAPHRNNCIPKSKKRPVLETSADESSETTISEYTHDSVSSVSRSVSSFTTSSSFDPYQENESTSDASQYYPSHLRNGDKTRSPHHSKPMLQIVQEMTEHRVVVSTTQVNRRKVRQWQQQGGSLPKGTRKHQCSKKKSKQRRVLNDNLCNEIIDQNREAAHCQNCNPDQFSTDDTMDNSFQADHRMESEGNEDETRLMRDSPDEEPIIMGKLQSGGSGKKPHKSAGKLMAKRLMRMSTDGRMQSESRRYSNDVAPPAKPPRTFHSDQSAKSDSSIDKPQKYAKSTKSSQEKSIHSAATTPADEIVVQTCFKKAKASRKLGWVDIPPEIPPVKPRPLDNYNWRTEDHVPPLPLDEFVPGWKPVVQAVPPQSIQPSCPNLDDISPVETMDKIGWLPKPFHAPPQPVPQHIVNMLYMDRNREAKIMQTVKMKAEPQVISPPKPELRPKENIDDVDGHISKHMQRFGSDTVFSTPQRHNICNKARQAQNNPDGVYSSSTLNTSNETQSDDLCINCHCPKQRTNHGQTETKPSFGKIALRRTKHFFEASKNMLNRSAAATTNKNLNQTMREGDSFHKNSNDDVDVRPFSDNEPESRCVTPKKLDTTERLNQEHQSHGKPTVKKLDLSQIDRSHEVPVESPKRMYEMFLASVKRTPPKKPLRLDLHPQNDFDFQRTVRSPSAIQRQQPKANTAEVGAKSSGGFLLSPRRLFGKTNTRRHSLNIEPESGSYKSFIDQDDDGFAIFIAEYLRKMYMKIESNRPIDGVTHNINDEPHELGNQCQLSSSSEDVVGDRLPTKSQIVEIDFHPQPEPFYQEIASKNVVSSSEAAAQSKPVYAVVNKKTKTKTLADASSISDLLASKSYDSLCLLNNTNDMNLVSSIENLLEAHFQGLKPKVTNEFKSMEDLISDDNEKSGALPKPLVQSSVNVELDRKCEESRQKSAYECKEIKQQKSEYNGENDNTKDIPIPDFDIKTSKMEPLSNAIDSEATIYSDIEEAPVRTSAIIEVHQSPPTDAEPIYMDAQSKTSTCPSIVMTESICDEVLLGLSINDDICSTMNRLESVLNLTEGVGYAQAYPESDNLEGEEEGDTMEHRSKDKPQPGRVTFNLADSPRSNRSPSYKRLTNTLRNSIRRGSQFFNKPSLTEPRIDAMQSIAPEDRPNVAGVQSYMNLLNNQIVHQRELRPQLQRAIDVCRSTSGFECSPELVEAERLLLLSLAKETAALCEMNRIDFDESIPVSGVRPTSICTTLGTAMLEIRRLECSLRPSDVFDMHHKFFYVCVVSYRNQVQATYAQEVCEEADDSTDDEAWGGGERSRKIVFDRLGMRFTGLRPNFQVKIEVLMLRLPHWFGGGGITGPADKVKFRTSSLFTVTKNSSESQPTSRFRSQDSAFVTPTNLWPINNDAAISRRYEFPQCTTVSSSSCIFSSSSQQRLIPFVSSEPHSSSRPTRTTNGQPIRMDFYTEIQLDIPDMKGFLNVTQIDADSSQLNGSRQWCWIRGCKLYMSASVKSSEQHKEGDNQQPIPPSLQTIDLTLCTNGPSLPLSNHPDDTADAQQYFTVKSAPSRTTSFPITEFRISADTDQTLRVWRREIIRILQFVHEWRL